MRIERAFSVLRERFARLSDQIERPTAEADVSITELHPRLAVLTRAGDVDLIWEPKGSWARSLHGSALLSATRAGLVVRMQRCSLAWNRYVLAHELGHSLFYDRSDLLPRNARRRLGRDASLPLRRDVWVAAEAEEHLCDEIADYLLMPEAVVRRTLCSKVSRLENVRRIADRCDVPIDRAYLRFRDVESQTPDACVQLTVWESDEVTDGPLRPESPVTLLYSEGVARIRGRSYCARDAGLAGVDWVHEAGASTFCFRRPIRLLMLEGEFGVEVVPSQARRRRWIVAYDRLDCAASTFAAPRLLFGRQAEGDAGREGHAGITR